MSLLSFVNSYLGPAIDQAAVGSTKGLDGRPLPSAGFLVSQLQTANEVILRLLRHAVQYHDSATVSRVLDAWKMPNLPLAGNAIQQATLSGTGPAAPEGLAQVLADAEADLNAALLRLFVTALDADQAAGQRAARVTGPDAGGAPEGRFC